MSNKASIQQSCSLKDEAYIDWTVLYPKLNLSGLCALLASHCALLHYQDDHWHFALDPEHSALYEKSQENLLATALSDYLNKTVRVSIEIATTSLATPEKNRLGKAQNDLEMAKKALQENPYFRQILEQFHATIVPGSIMSLEHENSTNEV